MDTEEPTKLQKIANLIQRLTYDEMMGFAQDFSDRTRVDDRGVDLCPEDERVISAERFAADFSDWAEQTLSEEG